MSTTTTPTRFRYTRGTWSNDWPLPEWQDGEEFNAYLMRIGYSSGALRLGSEHGSSVEIYENGDGGSFFALFTPTGSCCYEVFLPDLPSFMMFVKDVGSAFNTTAILTQGEETLDLLRKLFQAWHGHSDMQLCKVCDPTGWEQLQAMNAARR